VAASCQVRRGLEEVGLHGTARGHIGLKHLARSSGENCASLLATAHRQPSAVTLCRYVTNLWGGNWRQQPELSLGEKKSLRGKESRLTARSASVSGSQSFSSSCPRPIFLHPEPWGFSSSSGLSFQSYLADFSLPLASASV